MSSITSSIIFQNIFSAPDISTIWSDRARIENYLRFEDLLARAQADLGIIPHDAASEINAFCRDINKVNFEQLREETEKIGYPVLGLVKQIVRHVNAKKQGCGEWTHYGATTQDVTDTATVLQLRSTLELVSASLEEITKDLRSLARAHASTPIAARSNLQQAVPITFGFKLARLLATFERHKQRLKELKSRLLVLEFGGAAGTLASLPADKALQCQAALAELLGLSVPEIAWHTERDRFAELGGFFALLTGTCAKFAMDVKLLMQTEVSEVSEPFYEQRGSSSTMPQKRNPISCAYISAISTSVRSHAYALYEAMVADHERSTGPWEVEWIALPEICMLTCAALKHTAGLVAGLEVHPEAMERNLRTTKGGIVSEAVMMGLAPKMGRQVAHDLVYDLCRRSVDEDVPLFELLCDDEKVVSAELGRDELGQLCDPANYLGLSVEMVERVVGGE
ncbi:L-Aspartase-like protein [Gyrodon lividus]|nr:L-Aspartase-like protein [Gyrodon lividus]